MDQSNLAFNINHNNSPTQVTDRTAKVQWGILTKDIRQFAYHHQSPSTCGPDQNVVCKSLKIAIRIICDRASHAVVKCFHPWWQLPDRALDVLLINAFVDSLNCKMNPQNIPSARSKLSGVIYHE